MWEEIEQLKLIRKKLGDVKFAVMMGYSSPTFFNYWVKEAKIPPHAEWRVKMVIRKFRSFLKEQSEKQE